MSTSRRCPAYEAFGGAAHRHDRWQRCWPWILLGVLGCSSTVPEGPEPDYPGDPGVGQDDGDPPNDLTIPLDQDDQTFDDSGHDDASDIEPSAKFDLAEIPDIGEDVIRRCGIDFLFVVDNSGSMEDEQKNLIASFPGFIAGIRQTLDTQDYRVLITDSDSGTSLPILCINNDCECQGQNDFEVIACCEEACRIFDANTCNEKDCEEFGEPACYSKIGSGRHFDAAGNDCMIADGRRYILGTQPGIEDAFACAAQAGFSGSGYERVIDAMNRSIAQDMVAPGACNDGFLRQDTVLVVVLLTDEDEKVGMGSDGEPQDWYNTLIATKGGHAERVVMIGFIGDTGLPGALCEPLNENEVTGAEPSPRLHAFVDLFGDAGLAASICAPDYGPAFVEAINKIDAACDNLPTE